MAIIAPQTPKFVAESALREATAVRRALRPEDASRALRPEDARMSADEVGGGAEAPSASDPLPIYAVALDTLAADPLRALKEAKRQGWRVLTTDHGERQLVDLIAADDNHARPVAVRGDPSADILVRAGELAEKSVPPETEFEVRVLDFGRLGLAVLWVHNAAPETPDHFFTLEPDPKEQKQADLLKEAQSRAQRRLEADERSRTSTTHGSMPSDLGG